MKKPLKKRSPDRKSTPPKDVDAYLAHVPEPSLANFVKLRAAIRATVPRGATEIISYRIPAIRYNGVLLWFAAFSRHCSLFPTAAVIETFRDELLGFRVSKGTIHFPVDRPLPITLIKKIVKERVKQTEAKKRG